MADRSRPPIAYQARDGRAYVTIDRPGKRNALTFPMLDEIVRSVDRAEDDDDVKVIVLRGAGDDFCAGHDLDEVAGMYGMGGAKSPRRPSQRARLHWDRRHAEKFQRVMFALKPVLSLVRGHCIGAGLYLVEASDLAIADETARLGHPEQRMNLCGASYLLTWDILAMGPKRAREMLLLGEIMDAHAARDAGLVNRVVPDGQLAEAGEEWAEKIARLPRDGIAVGKMATHMALDSLGLTRQFLHGYVAHTVGSNVRFEPDEFNFLRERAHRGVSGAIKTREAFHGRPRRAR